MWDDLEWPPPSGCGTQHPHRALGGTCVLLAAAQQLLPVSATGGGRRRCTLAIFSGKIILNFGIAERLRAFRYPIFTVGVIKENHLSTATLLPVKK